jgi:hypothetical protein
MAAHRPSLAELLGTTDMHIDTDTPIDTDTDTAPAPANRAARRGKAPKQGPGDARYRGSAGNARSARSTAQGRRINPVRRTG